MVINGIKRQNSKQATYFFNCLILLLFTCQFQQIHTGNGLVPARHHCRNATRLDPVICHCMCKSAGLSMSGLYAGAKY